LDGTTFYIAHFMQHGLASTPIFLHLLDFISMVTLSENSLLVFRGCCQTQRNTNPHKLNCIKGMPDYLAVDADTEDIPGDSSYNDDLDES
jgi:hypothetical protein